MKTVQNSYTVLALLGLSFGCNAPAPATSPRVPSSGLGSETMRPAQTVSDLALEPNDSKAEALPLSYGGREHATVGGTDPEHWFVVEAGHEGELRAWILEGRVQLEQSREGNRHYVRVKAATPTEYVMLYDFRPASLSIDPPGTLVVGQQAELTGRNLGTRADLVRVTVDGVMAPILEAEGDRILIEVPYGAATGALRVVSGGRKTTVARVTVDSPAYPTEGFRGGEEQVEGEVRFLSGVIYVQAGPGVSSEELLRAVGPLGLATSGWSRRTNSYRLSGAPEGLADIEALAERLLELDEVTAAAPELLATGGEWTPGPATQPQDEDPLPPDPAMSYEQAYIASLGSGASSGTLSSEQVAHLRACPPNDDNYLGAMALLVAHNEAKRDYKAHCAVAKGVLARKRYRDDPEWTLEAAKCSLRNGDFAVAIERARSTLSHRQEMSGPDKEARTLLAYKIVANAKTIVYFREPGGGVGFGDQQALEQAVEAWRQVRFYASSIGKDRDVETASREISDLEAMRPPED